MQRTSDLIPAYKSEYVPAEGKEKKHVEEKPREGGHSGRMGTSSIGIIPIICTYKSRSKVSAIQPADRKVGFLGTPRISSQRRLDCDAAVFDH